MPATGTWENIYKMEYLQLLEEGFDVGKRPQSDMHGVYISHPNAQRENRDDSDYKASEWKDAYENLIRIRDTGIKKDWSYEEPNDYMGILNSASKEPQLDFPGDDEYIERLRGAWYGRCAGVILGKAFERGLSQKDIKKYLEPIGAFPLYDWVPYREDIKGIEEKKESSKGFINKVTQDDDVNYTITALRVLEIHGIDFTKKQWLDTLVANTPYPSLYSCTKEAYLKYINADEDIPIEEQIAQYPYKVNPLREGINPVIRTDMWGYISPCNIKRASKIAYNDASMNAIQNGIYGAMFIAAAISAAFTKEPTIDLIIAAGKSVIPKKSRLAEAIARVKNWHLAFNDWEKVCEKIYETYGHLNFAGGINNMCINVLALLHGNLDFTKTICIANMCGMDTDCNAGTVGSIVGAAIGNKGIDKKWIKPFNERIDTSLISVGETTFSEIINRMIVQYLKFREDLI